MVKFRLPDYQETDPKAKEDNKQSFTSYTPKYVYDEDTGELHLAVNPDTGEILQTNDQELIDSYSHTALDKVLERFLPQDYVQVCGLPSDEQFSDVGTPKDLSDYASILEHAEQLRDKYGLDSDMTCIDVFNYVDDLNKQYQSKMDVYNLAKAEQAKAEQAKAEQAKAEQAKTESAKVEQQPIDYDALAAAIVNQSKEVK